MSINESSKPLLNLWTDSEFADPDEGVKRIVLLPLNNQAHFSTSFERPHAKTKNIKEDVSGKKSAASKAASDW